MNKYRQKKSFDRATEVVSLFFRTMAKCFHSFTKLETTYININNSPRRTSPPPLLDKDNVRDVSLAHASLTPGI